MSEMRDGAGVKEIGRLEEFSLEEGVTEEGKW